jgi:adenylate cyclase
MRPTLRNIFAFSLMALLLGLALLFYQVLKGWQQTILESSERYRDLAGREVAQRVTAYLNEAPLAVAQFEQQIEFGDSVERGLLSLLLANDNISEATLTYADSKGTDDEGNLLTDRATAGQVAVLRSITAGEFVSKRTWSSGVKFVSETRSLARSATAKSMTAIVPAGDPTAHPTFQTAVRLYGQLISTDLHWSQIDESLPEAERRVELSVQKTIEVGSHGVAAAAASGRGLSPGHFAGVLRVGLLKSKIDGAVRQNITGAAEGDPHLIFLCDNQGRLITGWGSRDQVTVSGDDLRIAPRDAPPVVARALEEQALKTVGAQSAEAATSFWFGGQVYLCTFRALPDTQDWIVGIVVPRDFYLGTLLAIRRQVLLASLGLIAVIIVAGGLILRSVARAHSLILTETARMKEFEFCAVKNSSYLADIEEVLLGLEKAKTAMRAMSKYVPVDLVRQLYHQGEEPVLGGKLCELSVLFTDIKDFTAFSEAMMPDELAEVLGRYLQVMADIIQREKGTIDKYIGDAVMTFWNAPEAVAGHEILACRAALECRAALQKLYDSPTWGRAPRFETRFGLHRCTASVGHFGAPYRLNYTAIGDGINLASRLEGLNKYYGTQIIASENIYAAARNGFEFRLLDRVAVKGKTAGIVIYELLAERIAGQTRPTSADRYEQAFAHYQRGDFAAALELLKDREEDSPSRVLASRCRACVSQPPPAGWNGVHVFESQ